MLSAVGRATARRIQTAGLPSSTGASTAQLITLRTPATSALPIRSFAASASARLPAATGQKKPAPKKSTKKSDTPASTKKASTTTTSKSKAKKAAPAKAKAKDTKKEVDPAKKERAEKRKKLLEVRQLKKEARLDTPELLPQRPWLLHIAENFVAGGPKQDFTEVMREISASFHKLSETELEDLTRRAERNKETNAATTKAWIEECGPARNYIANQARRRINRLTNSSHKLIEDDRLPTRPNNGYTMFIKDNFPSNVSGIEGMRIAADKWKSASAATKTEYEQRHAADAKKYEAIIAGLEKEAEAIRAKEWGAQE